MLRFDCTGLGSSEGEFANTTFTSNVADLVGAEERRCIERDGEAEVSLAGRSFRLRREFLEDLSSHRMNDAVGHLGASLLVMHSPLDQLVGVDHARAIFDAARHPKSFVALDGADHLLSDRADAAYVADLLAAWSARYLPPVEPGAAPERAAAKPAAGAASEDEAEVVDGVTVEEEDPAAGLSQRVRAGRHTFIADEPAGIGQDIGPTPYDLLLAGLGACTSMTLRMYAQRRKFPLEHVRVTLRHERTHAEDCANADGRPCTIELVDREIELPGDLTEAQRADLARIADRCPVHWTLVGEIRVSTTILPGPA